MTEVITRPSKGATKAPARAKAAPTPTLPNNVGASEGRPEWLTLALQHVRSLSDMLYALIDADEKADGLIQELVEHAEASLCDMWAADSYINVTTDGVIWSQMTKVLTMLEGAWYAAEYGPLDRPPGIHEAVIPAAIARARLLVEALQTVPEDLSLLRKLDCGYVSAGARPHGDRPMPPIRREPESAQATHRHHAKDVQTVFETLATQALTLRDFLLDARTELEGNGGKVRAANDMLVAQHLAAFIGSMADEMCGGNYIGSPASWATMDSIEPIGGAA